MNLAILRVNGSDEALAALRQALSMEPYDTWKKGDLLSTSKRGKVRRSSGFSVSIADAKDARDMVAAIHAFLLRCRDQGLNFSGKNLAAELAIGLTAGTSDHYAAFLDFPADDLLMMGQLGIQLGLCAYPASE